MIKRLSVCFAALLMVGCVAEPVSDGISSSSQGSSSSSQTLLPPHEDLAACVQPEGLLLSDIDSVVQWINALPKPLSLACFIASLPRPLFYNATESLVSAQPSIGPENPRIFILTRSLILSYVTQEKFETVVEQGELVERWDADGKRLLELSYRTNSTFSDPQSIKAEIAFPVYEQLSASVPYRTILATETSVQTLCSGCHNNEVVVDHVEGIPVFSSNMLRNPFSAEVSEGDLFEAYDECEPAAGEHEWYRCRMYDATFGHGIMLWSSFADNILTFF